MHNATDAQFKYTALDNLGLADPSAANYTIPISFVDYQKAPRAHDVFNPSINAKATSKKLVPLVGSDTDGVVKQFRMIALNSNHDGTLYLQGIPVVNNQYISADVVDQLSFVPNGNFKGTTDYKYKVYDNDGLSSGNASIYIPVVNTIPIARNKTHEQVKKGITVKIAPVQVSDSDGVVISVKVLTLPALGTLQYDSAGNNTYVNVVVNRNMTVAQATDMRIIAGNTIGTTSFTYSAKDNLNDNSSTATYTIPIGAEAVNQKPIVNDVTSAPISISAGLTLISPIVGTDLDGTVTSYRILTVPPPYYGKLFYNSSISF